jgi:hypothetical protein
MEAAVKNKILAAAVSSDAGATFDSDILKQAGANYIINSWRDTDNILKFLENHSG